MYVYIFQFCATLGAAIVPLAFMSTWLLSRSVTAALFASVFILFGMFIYVTFLCNSFLSKSLTQEKDTCAQDEIVTDK